MKKASCLVLLALIILPFLGGMIRGLPTAFTEFPPSTQYVQHAPFNAVVFWMLVVLGLLTVCVGSLPLWSRCSPKSKLSKKPFPWWGWVGLFINVVSWICAWGRFEWLGVLKDHAFFPLWVGYILVMDGVNVRFHGQSMISQRFSIFLLLFPLSAIVWWYFEYLNRFVQNWRYVGTEGFSPLHYFVFATLCFATVLPAVFETTMFVAGFSRIRNAYNGFKKWSISGELVASVCLWVGVIGLVLMGIWPVPFFFMVWLAPLCLLLGVIGADDETGLLTAMSKGDYAGVVSLALAALMCGFFWEMWNWHSMPKWVYQVPYVNKYHVFEMPILGYLGYLPFGPLCWSLWVVLCRAVGVDGFVRAVWCRHQG